METIVENYGLSLIAVQIFDYLDDASLSNARLVKKSWRQLIDYEVQRRRFKREKAKLKNFWISKKYFLNAWPEWKVILRDFNKNQNYGKTRKLLKFLENSFHYYGHIMNFLDPLMIVIEINPKFDILELILPSIKNFNYQSPGTGKTLLHVAVTYGRYEIVERILKQKTCQIDLDIQDKYGTTILDEALARNSGIYQLFQKYSLI